MWKDRVQITADKELVGIAIWPVALTKASRALFIQTVHNPEPGTWTKLLPVKLQRQNLEHSELFACVFFSASTFSWNLRMK